MRSSRTILITAVLLFLAAASEAMAAPKRILLLHSFGRDFAPWNEYEKSIRAELDRQSPEPIYFYEASVVTAHFTDENVERPLADYLSALLGNAQPDLIVTVGSPAAGFFQRYRRQLFPGVPLLLAAAEERRVAYANLTANDAVVATTIDLAGVVENILRVLPKTTNIAMVIGNSPLEKYWLEQVQNEVKPFAKRVTFVWYNDLPFGEITRRAAALSPRSAVFLCRCLLTEQAYCLKKGRPSPSFMPSPAHPSSVTSTPFWAEESSAVLSSQCKR